MNYPLEKYKFAQTGNKVIAISTYAGRTVKGVAKCDPRDNFSVEDGKRLAAARCNMKVTAKRAKNAERCLADAKTYVKEAEAYLRKMTAYFNDASAEAAFSANEVDCILKEI